MVVVVVVVVVVRAVVVIVVVMVLPPAEEGKDKYLLAEASRPRRRQWGRRAEGMLYATHLGHILKPGDLALATLITAQVEGAGGWRPMRFLT